MSETLRKIDELVKVLAVHGEQLREEAREAGFPGFNLEIEIPTIKRDGTRVRVWLSRCSGNGHEGISAPTAEDAYTECARRLNWERDINMKRIS